jgi:hypothetical protein
MKLGAIAGRPQQPQYMSEQVRVCAGPRATLLKD